MKRIALPSVVALALSMVALPVLAQSQGTPPAGRGQTAPAPVPAKPGTPPSGAPPPPGVTPPPGVPTPSGYVIGPEDVLNVVFWREPDLSGDVIVRPDGMISIPLINEVQAAGQTPEQLRVKLEEVASKFVQDPNAVIVVKQINSRRVYITGMVNKIGAYSLISPTTVLQLIVMAGGLQDYADEENIVVVRNENGKQTSFLFNYKDVIKRRKLAQNIQLMPGDTVVVP